MLIYFPGNMVPVLNITFERWRIRSVQQAWHYKDESTGARVGPVEQGEVERLIADGRLQRSTVVWNPQMADWAKAGTTDLAGLFGATAPPLPADEISRWALYAVALFPFWGSIVQVAICSLFADPRAAFDHSAWFLFYIAGNCLFGWLDELNLERAGLTVKGAPILSAVLIPVYIYISCRTYQRHASRAVWFAYAPFVIWFLAVLLAFQDSSIFD